MEKKVYRGYQLMVRTNNPDHWMVNYEVWAAPVGSPPPTFCNGYLYPQPQLWKLVACEYIDLDVLDFEDTQGEALRRKVDAWIEDAEPDHHAALCR
jgi:hypothetical protein